jgi:hypothetical protein
LKLAQWFWRRRFLKIFSVFLLFCYYLPLERGNPLHLKKLEFLPSKDDLCQVWLIKIGPVVHKKYFKIFFSRTTGPNSIKLGTNHPWVKGIQVCSNEGPGLFQRGDNYKNVKIGWGLLPKFCVAIWCDWAYTGYSIHIVILHHGHLILYITFFEDAKLILYFIF